jgi:2-amino-4-hydroxy-6-hydroxymethyldihydropteridine diphosphokinase
MVILGLGSNSGDRERYLRQAVESLAPVLKNLRLSSVYETEALLPQGAPPSWNMPFLNMAAAGETALSPQALLATIKAIEKKLGRADAEVWAPRVIDVDILAMGDVRLDLPGLTIPHFALLDRSFALLPFVELAPDWRYPDGEYGGWKASDIAAAKGYHLHALTEKGNVTYG